MNKDQDIFPEETIESFRSEMEIHWTGKRQGTALDKRYGSPIH